MMFSWRAEIQRFSATLNSPKVTSIEKGLFDDDGKQKCLWYRMDGPGSFCIPYLPEHQASIDATIEAQRKAFVGKTLKCVTTANEDKDVRYVFGDNLYVQYAISPNPQLAKVEMPSSCE